MNRIILLGVGFLLLSALLPLNAAAASLNYESIAVAQGDTVTHPWLTRLDSAEQVARRDDKLILLNFSGSDWCAPCIRLEREVFADSAFLRFADTHLVLLNADFPRQRKNRLPAEQVKRNEVLAERYNAHGAFPFTVLLDAKGQVLAEWEGLWTTDSRQAVTDIQAHLAH